MLDYNPYLSHLDGPIAANGSKPAQIFATHRPSQSKSLLVLLHLYCRTLAATAGPGLTSPANVSQLL